MKIFVAKTFFFLNSGTYSDEKFRCQNYFLKNSPTFSDENFRHQNNFFFPYLAKKYLVTKTNFFYFAIFRTSICNDGKP